MVNVEKPGQDGGRAGDVLDRRLHSDSPLLVRARCRLAGYSEDEHPCTPASIGKKSITRRSDDV